MRSLKHTFYGAMTFALFFAVSQFAYSQTAETFDISRYSTAGADTFETFHVEETQSLQAVLDSEIVTGETEIMVTNTATGNLALVRDQMAFHHIAQGTADGLSWMATF
jgi:hypothetical protein